MEGYISKVFKSQFNRLQRVLNSSYIARRLARSSDVIYNFCKTRAMAIPVTLKLRQQYEASKMMKVGMTAMRTTPIPVTVRTFETQRGAGG